MHHGNSRYKILVLEKCNNMYCREQKKTGPQNHALTLWKMLHCKTVANIIITMDLLVLDTAYSHYS
jgi:hypothetical protein